MSSTMNLLSGLASSQASSSSPGGAPARGPRGADAAAFSQLLGRSRAEQPAGPTPDPVKNEPAAKPATQRPQNGRPASSQDDTRAAERPAAETAPPAGENAVEAHADTEAETEKPEDMAAASSSPGSPDLSGLLPHWPAAPAIPLKTASPDAPLAESAQALDAAALLADRRMPFDALAAAEPQGAGAAQGEPTATLSAAAEQAAAATLPAAALPTATVPVAPDVSVIAPPSVTVPAVSAPTAPAPSPAVMDLPAALHSPAFAPALATQLRWLVQDGVQSAQLRLNPAEMGPVAVQIVIEGNQARIDFSAEVAATRSVLEASLPVLAAALDDSGLKLAGGGVHDGTSSRHGAAGQQAQAQPPASGPSGSEPAHAPAHAPAPAPRGLVDLVA